MVPAAVYNFQQMLEYVALKNLDPALFAVLVQSKLLTTAIFRASLMGMRLRRSQVVSLLLLTTGVMLAQLHKSSKAQERQSEHPTTGVLATVGIALFSGFASVYTEKVIKRHKAVSTDEGVPSGLAYTQVQLALTSLIIGGTWALVTDWTPITTKGLWYGFDYKACIAAVNSAAGGLTVAAVLKYADAVLKGYDGHLRPPDGRLVHGPLRHGAERRVRSGHDERPRGGLPLQRSRFREARVVGPVHS